MKLKLVEGSGGLYERNNDAEAAASIMFLSQGGKVKLIFLGSGRVQWIKR